MTGLTEYRGQRALVFGSTGFIGRCVARHLAALGAEVICPVRDPAKAEQVLAASGVGGRIVQLDVRDNAAVATTLRAVVPDVTFNLAGYGVERGQDDAASARAINAGFVKGLATSVANCRGPRWSGPRIVHAGTAQEYGAATGDLVEATDPKPTTLYGATKLAGTRALQRICQANQLLGVTARLFTVYGPNEHEGRLLPTLIRSMTNDRPIELTTGMQQRDFTYVEDVAEGLLRLGLSSPGPGEIVNLCTGRLTSVRDFVLTFSRLAVLEDARLRFGALVTRSDEMSHGDVCIRRLKQLTGWSPGTRVAEGIARTLETALQHVA
jgi:nucleoside-diphosphate-sugar epimerase